MELIVINVGHDLDVISQETFAMLVISRRRAYA
jgi:hypothetical protein